MDIRLNSRRDQFAYFWGFVSRGRKHQFSEAVKLHIRMGYPDIRPEDAFEVCPFNDGFEQITRSYHIFENGKQADLPLNLQRLIGEFVFLVSDFIPDSCGDGRAFYARSASGQICMECDRCNQMFDLDGNPIKIEKRRLMTKADFLELCPPNTESDWAYHSKLRNLTHI